MQGPRSTSMSKSLVIAVFAVTGLVGSTISPAEAFSSTRTTSTNPMTKMPAPTTVSTIRSPTNLFVSRYNDSNDKRGTKQEGGEESEEDFQRRMAVVRSLQMSFYGKDASKEDTLAAQGNNSSKENASDSDSSKTTTSDSNSCSGPPELDASTGTISKLPLFRAAWYELPGRSNVFIIRDPIYTNMFERIFYTRNNNVAGNTAATSSSMTPWVFGHLYTPKDKEKTKTKTKKKKSLFKKKKGSQKRLLSAWNETKGNANTMASALDSPSVLGTLMYVRDYRRLKDGRILALVQAAEKFVVENVRQSLPYAIADVKVLPDVEELRLNEAGAETATREDSGDGETRSSSTQQQQQEQQELPSSVYSCDENDEDEQFLVNCLRADESTAAGPARARAILESIHSYHHYECDPDQRLDGIPDKSDLGIIDITHDAISRALPYCRFSNSTESMTKTNNAEILTKWMVSQPLPAPTTASPSLEFQLLRRGITKIPPSDRRFSYNTEPTYASNKDEEEDEVEESSSRPWTTEELEYELWLVIDYFSAATKKPLSPILLALLPSEDQIPKPWPSSFRLKKMLEEYRRKNPNAIASRSSSSLYPNQRRQRRFSFSAAHLLEGVLPISEGISGSSTATEGVFSDNFRNGGRRCAPESSSSNTGAFEVDEIQELRALLLSVPSTRQRLRVVLETFHRWRLYQECDEFA